MPYCKYRSNCLKSQHFSRIFTESLSLSGLLGEETSVILRGFCEDSYFGTNFGPRILSVRDKERTVLVSLTEDEAYELLGHCLQSAGDDTPLFREALRRLAWAIETREQERTQQAA